MIKIPFAMKSLFKSREINMTEGSVFPKILLFSIPLIMTNLLQTLYNAADMIVVGKFSTVEGAVGAIGATSSLTSVFMNLIMGASTGATVVVANAIGARDRERTERAVHTSIIIAAICGTAGMIIGVTLCEPILKLMRSDPALIDMSVLYCRVFFMGVPFTTVLNYAIAILRAKGNTTTPLIILACSGLLNVILNIVFILFLGMDVDGVALATVISNVCSMAVVMLILMRDSGWCRFSFKKLRICSYSAARIVTIGFPAGIQGTLFSISNVFIQSAVNSFGAAVVTGNSIGTNLETFVYTATNSIAQAALTFTGQNVGAGKPERIKRVARSSYLAGVMTAVILCTVLCAFRDFFAGLYINSESGNRAEILAAVEQKFRFMITPYFLVSMMEVGANLVRGMGKSILPMVVSLIGSCLFRITWTYTVFALVPELWILYISMPISWFITATVHFISLVIILKKYRAHT